MPAGGGANPLVVHILDCGITEADWADYESRIKALAERVHVKVDVVRHVVDMAIFKDLPAWNGAKATWTRLLAPRVLPNVDRCVFSDCDMLFVANPAEMLESLNEKGVVIAGHHEPLVDVFEGQDEAYCRSKGLPFNAATYFNAGLVAMDLDAFRQMNIVEQCFDFARKHSDVPYLDQTLLNQVCFNCKALLSDGWGLHPTECPAFEGQIKSIHFAGGCGWPFPKPKFYYHVLWLGLIRDAFDLWRDFETRVLDLPPLPRVKFDMRSRLLAMLFLFGARIANLLGYKVGHARLQRFVADCDHRTSALVTARQDLFGDIERWR
jgi:lipopolysaccharide biosynthesis glycosyltransferase